MTAEMQHPFIDPDSPGVLVVGAAGKNTEKMMVGLNELPPDHTVVGADYRDAPGIPTYRLDTNEGLFALQAKLNDGSLPIVYISTPPSTHEALIREYAQHPQVTRVVVAKPYVRSYREGRRVDQLLSESEKAKLFVHEHYKEKEPLVTVVKNLNAVMDRLGRRLGSVTIDINEAQLAEEEGRNAFEGAINDLGPHVVSIGMDIQRSINAEGGRYHISDHLEGEVVRGRYEDSALPEGAETFFHAQGVGFIAERGSDNYHPIEYVWTAGKGVENRKVVELGFVSDDDPEPVHISIDLQTGQFIDLPEELVDLFPPHEQENGYNRPIAHGLNGHNPKDYFQTHETALRVMRRMRWLRLKGQDTLYTYEPHTPLNTLTAQVYPILNTQ